MTNTYYQINDGRVWSVEQALFIDVSTIEQVVTEETDAFDNPVHMVTSYIAGIEIELIALYDGGQPADVDYLRTMLRFYDYPLGELKTRLDKIRDIQAEYAPQLTLLQGAKAGAEMRDDAEDVAEIKAEYTALLQEMNQKIQGVPND